MELNELKNAWGKVSEAKGQDHLVNTDEIRRMLQQRGSGILARLERNVRTGFWLLGIFLSLSLADGCLPYDRILPCVQTDQITTLLSIKIIGMIVNGIVMLTFILFVYRYHKLKIRNLAADNMQVALRKVIQLLDTFKKEFYLALVVFSCALSAGFIMGAWEGLKTITCIGSVGNFRLIIAGLVIVLIMAMLIALIFYIFHKGFNSLYGKYRQQLIGTLNELNETED
jgi:hypothetical protein